MRKKIPLGIEDFREIREGNYYYVDKTKLISDLFDQGSKVTLITRPRRFGKTLGMSMIYEFFDITKESKNIFDGLAIMDTEYSEKINTKPVVFLSFKDCSAKSPEELVRKLANILFREFRRFVAVFEANVDRNDLDYVDFYYILEKMISKTMKEIDLYNAILVLVSTVSLYYKEKVVLLIDEYDQPILASYEYHFREEMQSFFSDFYTSALKGNEYLFSALLTGIQRVAKESIFSKLNNVIVYTVLHEEYSAYFGMNTEETSGLLQYYGLELNNEVKAKYDGYLFGKTEMYNPWSIINYASKRSLDSYWINTSTNYLIREAIASSGTIFQKEFDTLLSNHKAVVGVELETSFIELQNSDTLWGLLINSGYLTVLHKEDELYMTVTIPNGEVRSEFQKILAEQANISGHDLRKMFQALLRQDIDEFFVIYSRIVLSCTSYFDSKENAYHMLFLGMCISLKDLYKITSNIEAGYGRSDITMESLSKSRYHIIIEFKQGEEKDLDNLKHEAINQIIENEYYTSLKGKILLLGIAHHIKKCEIISKMIEV